MNFLRLIKAESYTRGMMLSVAFNIVSKGILFLLTVIIARYFGSDIKTDIFFFVFTTMVLFSGFVNSLDTAVLIPESMRLREKEGETKAMDFLNYFLLIYFIIGVLFTVIMYFFGTNIFGIISKFAEADIITYQNYFWTGSLFFIFHVLTNYLNNILAIDAFCGRKSRERRRRDSATCGRIAGNSVLFNDDGMLHRRKQTARYGNSRI